MTKVVVDPGICGFTSIIETARLSTSKVRITITTDCDMISRLGSELKELDWRNALGSLKDSLVYKSAFQHVKHSACPIPAAILKSIEVEVGAALPKDVVIHIETINSKDG